MPPTRYLRIRCTVICSFPHHHVFMSSSSCIGALSCARSHRRLYSKVSDGAPDDLSSMPPLMSCTRFLAMNHLEWYLKVDYPPFFSRCGTEGSVDREVGSSVRSVRPGDRVTMEPGVSCRRCEACRTGRYHVCNANVSPFPQTLSVQLALS